MEEQLFNELIASIKEAGSHLKGKTALPAENIQFVGEPDPRAVRKNMGLTREQFAVLLGISIRTLENWEQGRRDPTGPAIQLLRIAQRHPEILLELA